MTAKKNKTKNKPNGSIFIEISETEYFSIFFISLSKVFH